ncbi:bifunctional phosphoribosylaminoimidazolecarboxamide formyltransferase/IMP cyclohydrolase [mine drainage metagenome]|uniref:Bifunctional phosphoribosylaminoimidazolecarboxamide formyltransferase/IMP cyclohydrolase n=1 Tax=mine drainage metagenome TaxID=410659 RepID=T0YHF3_9ZZZZ
MNILASVFEKKGLDSFLGKIIRKGDIVYATGKTAEFLNSSGIDAVSTSSLSGFDELLGGRVKTLVPSIFAGILSNRDPKSNDELKALKFPLFDMVVSNLYPFRDASRTGDLGAMIENIDIGGVSLIRAAAKNYAHVTVITGPDEYGRVSQVIALNGSVPLKMREELAVKAFAVAAQYDIEIYNSLTQKLLPEKRMENLFLSFQDGIRLRYGENPDQEAFMYHGTDGLGIPNALQMSGKELSYNNILDSNAAYETAIEFEDPTVVIVKHLTPCGVASSGKLSEAYKKAFEADPESAYGFVMSSNREIDHDTASIIAKNFAEVVVAPSYSQEAFEILRKRKNLRILRSNFTPDMSMRIRSVSGGILAQTPLRAMPIQPELKTAVGASPEAMEDLIFAWKVVAHSRSNAIVLAKSRTVTGMGSGQTSRVRALKIAGELAGKKAEGSVLASDAYFPFADSVEEARRLGIRAIIQPGGSIRDEEVIKKCEEYSIPLYFTGKRVFLH